jgi:hypothetical protein
MTSLRIEQLRPTQFTHGMREVRDKLRMYASLAGHELEMAIAEKPIPFVLGPGEVPFAIDHHHVATALWHAGIAHVPGVLVSDLSGLNPADFWLTLENRRWTHPYDPHGRRVSFADMPAHIWEGADDDFRSLAAFVRDAGGFEKSPVPLAEFRWADLFRQAFAPPGNDDAFASLIERGVKLAKTGAALGLPGYIGTSAVQNESAA